MPVQLVHTNKEVMSFRIDPAMRLDLHHLARMGNSSISQVVNSALKGYFLQVVREAEEQYATLKEELAGLGSVADVLGEGEKAPGSIGRLAAHLEELDKSAELLRVADTFQSLLSVSDLELIDEQGFLTEAGRKTLDANLVQVGLSVDWLVEEMPKYGHSSFQEMWEGKEPFSFRLLARIDIELMNRGG